MPHSIPSFPFDRSAPDGDVPYSIPETLYRPPSMPSITEDSFFSRARWYGEHFFRFSLERAIFKNAIQLSTGESLRLKQIQCEIEFPYNDFIEKLDGIKIIRVPAKCKGETTGSFDTFVTKLGVLLHDADSAMENQLAHKIQVAAGVRPSSAMVNESIATGPLAPGHAPVNDSNIALYCAQLGQWAKDNEKIMNIKAKQTSVDPPLNEVTVRIDGEEFKAQAKKQMTAKHIACKQACERLGIEV